MKKKLLILTLAITLGLAACGSKTETKDNTPVSSSAAGSKETKTDTATENKSSVSTKESTVESTTKEDRKEKTAGEEIWNGYRTAKFTTSVPVSKKEYTVEFFYSESNMDSAGIPVEKIYSVHSQGHDALLVKEGQYASDVHKLWEHCVTEFIELDYVGAGKKKDDGTTMLMRIHFKTKEKEVGHVLTDEEIDEAVADFLQLVKDLRNSEYFDDSSMSDISFDKSFIPEDTRQHTQGRFTSPDAIEITK